jgi:hypothetical protein
VGASSGIELAAGQGRVRGSTLLGGVPIGSRRVGGIGTRLRRFTLSKCKRPKQVYTTIATRMGFYFLLAALQVIHVDVKATWVIA